MEHGYSDSTSSLSEAPDIANWFSSYVYESPPLTSTETERDGFPVGEQDLGVGVSPEKVLSNNDHKPMRQISDTQLSESFPSEPPDIRNWFSSYVYESPILDTSDSLQLSVPGDSECLKETETENERNIVCPRLFDQQPGSSAKVTDFSQSQSLLSEPPDIRNWFSSYEYQSPQLSEDTLEFTASDKDQLIIDESDIEDEDRTCIFRKTKSRRETKTPGSSTLKDFKEIITADMAKEVSLDNASADQQIEKNSLGQEQQNASTKGVKQESVFNPDPLFFEPKVKPSFSTRVYPYDPKPQSPLKNEDSLHEVRPKEFQETISMNSSRQNSPRKEAQKACTEENMEMETTDQESDDKENVTGISTETGFVMTKKARFRESRDRCSMKKPNRGVLVECSTTKELKEIAKEEQEQRRRKKRKVLGEMSNHQSPGAEEIAGKWLCPQKNKEKLPPPMKQLRLDAWVHKV